jgi:hypothetical protein
VSSPLLSHTVKVSLLDPAFLTLVDLRLLSSPLDDDSVSSPLLLVKVSLLDPAFLTLVDLRLLSSPLLGMSMIFAKCIV